MKGLESSKIVTFAEILHIQGQSRQTVNFDFDLMGTSHKIVLGFIGYKWALVMDISLSEAKMLKYKS